LNIGGKHVTPRSKWGWVLAAGLAVVVVAGDCGVAARPGPAPIRIGAIVSISGIGLGSTVPAYRAAERSINAHGGIRGRPVRVEVCDDRYDPNLAQACARQLISDGVIATAGDISGLSMVEDPILDEAGVPEVMNEAVNEEDFTLPSVFLLDGGIFVTIAGELVGMKRRGLRSLFAITGDVQTGQTIIQMTAQLSRAAGVNLAGNALVPLAATDLTSYVHTAMQSKADLVFPVLPPPLVIRFMQDSRRAGARYLVMVPSNEFTPRNIGEIGGREAITENDVEFGTLPPLSATDRFPALKSFQADMDAQLATGDRSAARDRRTGSSLSAWLAVRVIARETAALEVMDRGHLMKSMRTKPVIGTLGLTPPWSPGRTGLPNFPRVTNPYGYEGSQRNGVEVLVDPTPFNPMQVLGLTRDRVR
jgi:ABC-type branched-subunit amino acid transport system substrate-binding protein